MNEFTKTEPKTVTVEQLYVKLSRLDAEKAVAQYLRSKGYEPEGLIQVKCSLCCSENAIESIDVPVKKIV